MKQLGDFIFISFAVTQSHFLIVLLLQAQQPCPCLSQCE